MQIKDSFVIKAPQEKVWEFLFDIPKLSQCMPGIESVEVVDDKTIAANWLSKWDPSDQNSAAQ